MSFLLKKDVTSDEVKANAFLAISAYKKAGSVLYRGERQVQSEIELHKVDKDRYPKDTAKAFHDWLNEGFISVFGEPVRSQCIFGVRDKSEAKKYGTPLIPIPSGEYHFYYSDVIQDLFEDKWIVNATRSNKEFTDEEVAAMGIKLWLNNSTSPVKYDVFNFLELKSKFKSPKAPGIAEYLIKVFPNAASTFVSTYYKKSSDFSNLNTIRKKNEVMIICDTYYIVSESIWENELCRL